MKEWFNSWNNGDYKNIPIHKNFIHKSPYGIVNGKNEYLEIVSSNEEVFLGNTLIIHHNFCTYKIIHDELYEVNKTCVRYKMNCGDLLMEVAEWYYLGDDKI